MGNQMIITGQAENKEMTIEEIKTLIKKSEYEVVFTLLNAIIL